MHLDDTFRNKPSEKAELFNNNFYKQFSGPSNYNTDMNFSNDQGYRPYKFKDYSRIKGKTQNIIQSETNFKYKRQLFTNL